MRLEKNVGHRWEKGDAPWNKGKHTTNFGNGFKKGNIPWNKGLIGYRAGRITPETIKKKISKSCKGRKVWITGKTHSEKTRKKLSNSKIGNKNPMYGIMAENHPNWNGGSKSYYRIIAIKVWEDYWMQKVPEGQLIHHFDGNRENNEITNLVNMPFGFHSKYHMLKYHELRRLDEKRIQEVSPIV